jgi:hypothetical protein
VLKKNWFTHALDLHERNNSCNLKTKQKGKGTVHYEHKKEGNHKLFDDSSGSKGEKGKKGKSKCGYCNRDYHPKSACMKKKIDLMEQILHKNNIGEHIPKVAKKKS